VAYADAEPAGIEAVYERVRAEAGDMAQALVRGVDVRPRLGTNRSVKVSS
jgi:hypothetical protein